MRLRAPTTAAPGGGVEPQLHLDFLSSDELAGQGVSLFPAATPPTVNNGLQLNGTTQYARVIQEGWYSQAFRGGVSNELTVYHEFFPDFNYNEATVARPFLDCPVGNRYLFYKSPTGPGFSLQFYAGAFTFVGGVAAAAYGALWRVGQKNRMAAALKSGANVFYLNGSQIGTSVTAWVRGAPTGLYIGSTNTPDAWFAGTIKDFRIYNRQLTAAEAIELTTVT